MRSTYKLIALNLFLAVVVLLTSCEQQTYEPVLTVAPGGGTITTYKAYALPSANGSSVYGRIVFYKYSTNVTLVQIGLYNTTSGSTYSALIQGGKVADAGTTTLVTLDTVDGATGAFSAFKYFTITTANFYDQLDEYNANVKIRLASTNVSAGDIGLNADPVAESE